MQDECDRKLSFSLELGKGRFYSESRGRGWVQLVCRGLVRELCSQLRGDTGASLQSLPHEGHTVGRRMTQNAGGRSNKGGRIFKYSQCWHKIIPQRVCVFVSVNLQFDSCKPFLTHHRKTVNQPDATANGLSQTMRRQRSYHNISCQPPT